MAQEEATALQRAQQDQELQAAARQAILQEFHASGLSTPDGNGTIDLEEWEQNLRPDLRAMVQEKLRTGWKFDPALWADSQARHSHWSLAKVFSKFDTSNDGYLTMMELMRAFKAIGLPKREGEKLEMDRKMFQMLDVDGSGMVSLDEFEEHLPDDVSAKIIEKLEAGWVFEPQKWSGRRDK